MTLNVTVRIEDIDALGGTTGTEGASLVVSPYFSDLTGPAITSTAPVTVDLDDGEGSFGLAPAEVRLIRPVGVAGLERARWVVLPPDDAEISLASLVIDHAVDPATLEPLQPLPPSAQDVLDDAAAAADSAEEASTAAGVKAFNAGESAAVALGHANDAAAAAATAGSAATSAVAPYATIIDSGRLSPSSLEDTISTVSADQISNPETQPHEAVVNVVESALGGGVEGLTRVFTGAMTDPDAARPTWAGIIDWWIFEGDSIPTNLASGDVLTEVEVEPLPDVVLWSDDFNRANGSLGTTPIGGFAWAPKTVTIVNVVGNQAQVVSGASAAMAAIDAGTARTRLIVTAANITGGSGSAFFRYQDASNHYLVARVSSGTQNYRVVKRLAGVNTDIAVTSIPMVDGDVLEIDDMVVGALKIYVNSVLIYEEGGVTALAPATELINASQHGLYAGTPTAGIAWDNAICYVAG